jgi:hypothetical protein
VRVFALLVLAGCAPAPPPEDAPAPAKAVDVPSSAVLDELLRGRTLEEQARIMESQRWYEMALAAFNKGAFDKAKEAARRAVQLWPEHLAARKLLSDIHSIVGQAGPPRGLHEQAFRTSQVWSEQARIEVVKHLRDGERFLAVDMHERARREFEEAERKARELPCGGCDLLPSIRAGLAASR